MALSSAEVEYMAASLASCEDIWLCKMLTGLFDQYLEPTLIDCNNQSYIKLSKNPMFRDKSRLQTHTNQISLYQGQSSKGSTQASLYFHK